eukprot:EG_transcript_33033
MDTTEKLVDSDVFGNTKWKRERDSECHCAGRDRHPHRCRPVQQRSGSEGRWGRRETHLLQHDVVQEAIQQLGQLRGRVPDQPAHDLLRHALREVILCQVGRVPGR